MWVVEATLKPGKRHVYSKRTFYLDEDSWAALAADQYDARGQLYRVELRLHGAQLRRAGAVHRHVQPSTTSASGVVQHRPACIGRVPAASRYMTEPLRDSAVDRPTRWPAPASADRRRRPDDPTRVACTCLRTCPHARIASRARVLALRGRCAAPRPRGFVDVLDTPAHESPLAAQRLLRRWREPASAWSRSASAATSSCSDDGGATWQQRRCR